MSDILDLAAALVREESVNPDLVPGGSGEAGAARVVADWAERAGLEVVVEDAAPGRPNAIVTARGSGGGRTLLLNGHLDTVGLAGMERPLEPELRDGRLYGRGSYDMKGAVAAALVAAARAKRRGLRGDVVVTCVADEELGSCGTERVARTLRADAAIVCEPTEERLCVAHRGFVTWELETRGVAAHGSRPDLGVDAIARMGPVLVRLSELADELLAGAAHPLLGTASLHASLVEGGQEYSSYPERCILRGERRTLPGETPADVEHELRRLLGDADGEARVGISREPLDTSADSDVARALARVAHEPGVHGVPFWADSALLAAAGIPTVLYGPAGEGAHAVVEWVDAASLERCADVYEAVAAELCG